MYLFNQQKCIACIMDARIYSRTNTKLMLTLGFFNLKKHYVRRKVSSSVELILL